MGKTHVNCKITINAPIEKVFAKMTDHRGMTDWPGVTSASLVSDGSPTVNGVGAVRRITAKGLTIDEEIVGFFEPTGYDYTIIKGLPVKHFGTVRFSEWDGGVDVEWNIDMSSKIPFFAQLIGSMLRRNLPDSLKWLKEQLET